MRLLIFSAAVLKSYALLSRLPIAAHRSIPYRPTTTCIQYNSNPFGIDENLASSVYEKVPCPAAIKDQVAYVSGFGEFLNEGKLTQLLFRPNGADKANESSPSGESTSTVVQRYPANPPPLMIARGVDTSSLKYGFIVFQNNELRDSFIEEFDGREFCEDDSEDACSYASPFTLKVEAFGGEDKDGTEAKLPLKLVEFVLGKQNKSANRPYRKQNAGRISGDDVLRLSRGQPAKTKGKGSRGVPHRLNSEERAEFERSERRGYLRIDGTGYRRERKGSPLCNVWRQHCDSVGKPVVIMMKASGRAGGGRTEVGADSVVVDWSTLRDPSNEDTRKQIDIDVAKAAADNNMELKELDEEEELSDTAFNDPVFKWDADPIWKLPALNLSYEGQRSSAQAMCKALALHFDTMKKNEEGEPVLKTGHKKYGDGGVRGPKSRRDAGAKGGGKTKPKKFKRQRGGGKSREDQLKDWHF
ncbi:hypothetical protein TrVE_jg7324 [Triparma verrucosa]|uniref:Uncharacterized protein n=1 Tax=Triparma verrucosa TaxID=1606542 RepID=A0A9W7FML3_9STRA|nr:hypothetical protein TrVE_jg7324 [Triparma verrucosa]